MRVLLAAGGTAGHINPALAIAGMLHRADPSTEFLFAGTPDGMEARLVPQAGYPMEHIHVAGFQRRLSLENIGKNAKAVAYLMSSGPRARQIVREFAPELAVGTGGYVSGPVIRAAAKLGVPCVIHEQNAYPGVTNRLLAGLAKKVMLTFGEAAPRFDHQENCVVTGLPVRASILEKRRAEARAELGLDDSMTILSFGGSLGAGCINETMLKTLAWHTTSGLKINHIHGYGKMGHDQFLQDLQAEGVDLNHPRIRVTEYIHDMDTCLAAADLVICRAGASTLAELEAVGRASILIPSPIVTANHQYHNAMVLGNAGAAIVREQKDVTAQWMIAQIQTLYDAQDRLVHMAQCAANLAIRDTEERIMRVLKEALA